jgi:two-component system chemotaxis response regulator CheY
MGKKVLIVDDSASIRQMVEMTLKESGYEVTVAKDGLEALNLCKTEVLILFLLIKICRIWMALHS